jgi:hypothetical protein
VFDTPILRPVGFGILMKRFGSDEPMILRIETVGLGRCSVLSHGWTSSYLAICDDESGRTTHVPWLDVLSIEVIG